MIQGEVPTCPSKLSLGARASSAPRKPGCGDAAGGYLSGLAFPPHLTTGPPFSRTQSRLLHGPTPLCPGCGEEDVFLAPDTPVFLVHVSRGPPPFRAHLGHPAFHFSPSVSFPGSSPWYRTRQGKEERGSCSEKAQDGLAHLPPLTHTCLHSRPPRAPSNAFSRRRAL